MLCFLESLRLHSNVDKRSLLVHTMHPCFGFLSAFTSPIFPIPIWHGFTNHDKTSSVHKPVLKLNAYADIEHVHPCIP